MKDNFSDYVGVNRVVLEVVYVEVHRLLKECNILNADLRTMRRIGNEIGFQLVQKLAKHKLQKPIVIRYPKTWWDAVKEHWCPKIQKKIKWFPKWAQNPFYNCVTYAEVTIHAEVFYDQLVIHDEQHYIVMHDIKGDWNPNA